MFVAPADMVSTSAKSPTDTLPSRSALKSHLAAGLSGDAYIAMLPLLAQNMRELLGNREMLGNNCSNIAVLLKKYSNFCQRLSQGADPRLKEWIAFARARQQTCSGPGLP